jgi:hypothetical protein
MIQWVTIKDLPEDGQQYTIEISHGTRNKKMDLEEKNRNGSGHVVVPCYT